MKANPTLETSASLENARVLRASLLSGECDDNDAFDQFLPDADRRVSAQYWTPLQVASRAAQWLQYFGARSVVDVGSGVGKFCVAAALTCGCRFTGVEHRARLVDAADVLARTFEVDDRVAFIRSTSIARSWPDADAYYLYNPFGENLSRRDYQLDSDVELSLDRYRRDVAAAERFIEAAPIGTFLLTYNGFGGRIPDSYEEVAIDRAQVHELRMWRKSRQLGSRRVLRAG
jgi:predicted RNA methylase